jgi:hypothetical protein
MGSRFVDFLRSFGVRWFVAMSGPLSVPLALGGYFISNEIAKFGLFVTAAACLVFAAYWVWRVERQARVLAEAKLTPKTIVTYDPQDEECRRIVTFTDWHKGKSFRVRVCSDVNIESRGLLAEIHNIKTGQTIGSVEVRWATLGVGGPFTRLVPTVEQYLNVCVINDRNKLGITPVNAAWPADMGDIFDPVGEYVFRVVVDSRNDAPSTIALKLNWTGDWQTTEMVPC